MEKLFRHQNDVVSSFAQGRHLDDDNCQAKIKILAESAGCDSVLQVGIGRRDDASISLKLLAPPNSLECLFLQKPEQFYLNRRGQVADFVKEQRAAGCGLDEALALHVCSREGAFLVAEEFALK